MANMLQILEVEDALNAVSVDGFNVNYQSIFTDLVLAKAKNINDLTIRELREIHDQASAKFNQQMDK